jgi:hypothetical protein
VYSLCITIQIRDTQHKFTRWLRTLAGSNADKEVVKKLKLLYGCQMKEKFEETLAELQKVLNGRAKS